MTDEHEDPYKQIIAKTKIFVESIKFKFKF